MIRDFYPFTSMCLSFAGVLQLIGIAGVVNYIHSDGDPELRYNTNHIFKFNADAVAKVASNNLL